MSKFTELCSAYTEFRNKLSDTRFSAYNFSCHVIKNYLDYLGIDNEDAYKIIPLDKDEKPNTKYTPAGATHLGDDGFWHLGFILTIYKDPNTYPQSPFQIDFKFRKNDDESYTFGVDSIGFATKIFSLSNSNEFTPVFDKIQECILGHFQEFEDFLVGKHDKMSSIGFIQESIFAKINSEKNE
ncbi:MULTISPECIES: hypothetical protein [Klebsiella]|uniref:hypothetical protein n=1 Tax=Klebsiella TaxID=570 RepID=UPI000A2E8ADE|nr:hypothetical protein [Klebsiella michiganensis]OSY90416.1 hypothetical protein BM280_25035 [Klebsiella michiganensis]HBQ7163924.1 hypothetical protein [Klebsiella pneumoniae]HDZ9646747.1 hypothetical protein [Klebsiella pneumoniae]